MTPMLYSQECSRCYGEGTIEVSRYGGNDPDTWRKPCPVCDGAGVVEVDLNDEAEEDDE